MSYVVSPPAATTWRVDPADFIRALTRQWSHAEISMASHPASNHALEWRVVQDGQPVEGSLARDGQAVHLDGDLLGCAQVAVWVRTLVPPPQPLVFYDEGYAADVPLFGTTTAQEIVDAFI